jgi:hypothetical protein
VHTDRITLPKIQVFFELLDDPKMDKKLRKKGLKLKQFAEKRFGYCFSIESLDNNDNDENAPVVVNVDPDKMQTEK